MLCSCTHRATEGVKGLTSFYSVQTVITSDKCHTNANWQLKIRVDPNATFVDDVQHCHVCRDGAHQTRRQSSEKPTPPAVFHVKLPDAVWDTCEASSQAFRFVGLHRRLDDVSGICQRPVEEPGGTGRPPDYPCRRMLGIASGWSPVVLHQLIETCISVYKLPWSTRSFACSMSLSHYFDRIHSDARDWLC